MEQVIKENNKAENAYKRQIINPTMFDHIELPDLVTAGSLSLFQKLGVSSEFMEEDPKAWPLCDDCCGTLMVVNALTVTKDHDQ